MRGGGLPEVAAPVCLLPPEPHTDGRPGTRFAGLVMSNEQEHNEEHASLIKTPKQLIVTVVLAFIVPITIILLLVNMISIGTKDAPGSDGLSPEAVAKRIAPVAGFELVEADATQAQTPAAQPAAPAPAPAPAAPAPAAQAPQQQAAAPAP